jgi:hypothetical protein
MYSDRRFEAFPLLCEGNSQVNDTQIYTMAMHVIVIGEKFVFLFALINICGIARNLTIIYDLELGGAYRPRGSEIKSPKCSYIFSGRLPIKCFEGKL